MKYQKKSAVLPVFSSTSRLFGRTALVKLSPVAYLDKESLSGKQQELDIS